MSKTINDILKAVDADNTSSWEMQKEYKDDIIFSRVSQWNQWLEQYTSLEYKGQFDVIRGEIRRLMAEMLSNPIQVRFRPMENSTEDDAELLEGMYRTDMRDNRSMNALKIAMRNQLEGGFGAWRLVTEYEDDGLGGNTQVINRHAIHDTASCCLWDSNARTMDKSDAKHCTIITGYSHAAYEELAKENDWDASIASLSPKSNLWIFHWVNQDKIYVGEHYALEERADKVFYFEGPNGEVETHYKSDMKKVIDDLDARDFIKVSEKKVTRTDVNKYIVSGTTILEGPIRVAGKHIPVVPVYGEWSIIEAKEVYEGVVRLAKDGQRLRNAILSYNTDIMLRSPRKKPFFFQEQIQGYEHMYEGENDYPYYLVNRVNMNGEDLPAGAMSYLENPEISQQSAFLLDQATASVKEVTTDGVSAEGAMASRMAEGSIQALNKRTDLETFIFQDNFATAMRRDGEIYMSMRAEIFDTEREVVITGVDNKETKKVINQQQINFQAGQVETVNRTDGKFEVWTDVGPAYQTQKEQNRDQLLQLMQTMNPQLDPEGYKIAQLSYYTMLEGPGYDLLRDYANKQLLIMGLREPEDEQEMMMLQQIQQQQAMQSQQPSPDMLAAQSMMVEAKNKEAKLHIDMYGKESDRMRVNIEAQEAQVDAMLKKQDFGLRQYETQVNAQAKMLSGMMGQSR